MVDVNYSMRDNGNGIYTVTLENAPIQAADGSWSTHPYAKFTGNALDTINFIIDNINLDLVADHQTLTPAQATELLTVLFDFPTDLAETSL